MFASKNIKKYYSAGKRKIRCFLLSEKSRELLVFLFFVFVSFCFWSLQTLNNTYQTEFKVPIRLRNVPKEVVMTSELPQELRVRVEDRGTVLLNYMLGRTFFPVTFDFKDYEDQGSHVFIPTSEIMKKVSAQLNTTTRLLSLRPDTLDFIYTRGAAKKIPVAVSGNITAGQQYYVSELRLEPDSVVVYAPSDVLNAINTVYTLPIEVENITDTLRRNVRLQGMKGAKFVPSATEVMVCVDMFSEKTLEVPIAGRGFPAGKVLRTFPSKVQLTFQVGLKNFRNVSEDDFSLAVSYDDVQNAEGGKVPVRVLSAPDFVSHIRLLPEKVDFLIEQRGGQF